MARHDGDTTARKETAETTQNRPADEEGQEVTTMVNYVAATTWWNAVNQRDADKEILLGARGASPQPEDA